MRSFAPFGLTGAGGLVLVLAFGVLLPGVAMAAGSGGESSSPPKPTETTKTCFFGRIYDPETKKCVKVQKDSALDQDLLYGAVRELAYDGQFERAQQVLRVMDQDDDRVMTYWGFTHRKMGDTALAESFYLRAIDANPDNILARSYMGQGYIATGRTDAAIAQWREIMARGGEGTWAETALRQSIRSGITFNY